MRALILAAGRGSRMAQLTNNQPKCLVELAGVSLLDHQLAALNNLGIDDITVLAGHMGEMVTKRGHRTVMNPDYSTSNMVYTLFCAGELMTPDTDMIIAYGDIVYEPSVLKALISCDSAVCVVVDTEWRRLWRLRMEDPLSDAETLKLDERGMIQELGKKPHKYDEIQGQYIGLIKVRFDYVQAFRQMYEKLDPDGFYDGNNRRQMYMTSYLQHLIDSSWQVKAVPVANGWLEVDTASDLELYERMHEQGTLAQYYNASAITDGTAGRALWG